MASSNRLPNLHYSSSNLADSEPFAAIPSAGEPDTGVPDTSEPVTGEIILHLASVMADRNISVNDLSEQVGISTANLSKIKNNRVTAVRFSTLAALCSALDCTVSDLLEYRPPVSTSNESATQPIVNQTIIVAPPPRKPRTSKPPQHPNATEPSQHPRTSKPPRPSRDH